ncbi:MAG TPA: UxaA family hydrolase [Opitutus sp.]|nr:UxaA family hydrolase [Opitutus sp.]
MSETTQSSRRLTIKMGPADDVAMALEQLKAGATVPVESSPGGAIVDVSLVEDIPLGHKFALRDIRAGERVIKYNMEIGTALKDIPRGAWVGEHNLE